jgi:hypothetical protein
MVAFSKGRTWQGASFVCCGKSARSPNHHPVVTPGERSLIAAGDILKGAEVLPAAMGAAYIIIWFYTGHFCNRFP